MMLCSKKDCTACAACVESCPKIAISLAPDALGALYPHIDSQKCVGCRICEKKCPALNESKRYGTLECYAAWSKDPYILERGATAGIVTTLALQVIEENGIVFGTRYEKGVLTFAYAETKSDVLSFQGSKYVHAFNSGAYCQAKYFLDNGRRVMFAGTPCQIAGLKSFLGKEYSNLLTVDLICHGVAPQKLLKEYLKAIVPRKTFDQVLFRSRYGSQIVALAGDCPVYRKNKLADLFYASYAKGILHRENCYNCIYASTKRVSDITVGDFWGIHREKLVHEASNVPFVSLVLVNSQIGAEFVKKIEPNVVMEAASLADAMAANRQLSAACEKPPEREKFLQVYQKQGIIEALKSTSIYSDVRREIIRSQIVSAVRFVKRKIFHV